MDTVASIRKHAGRVAPYPRPVMLKIAKIKDNTGEGSAEASLVDHTGAIKAIIYDNMLSKEPCVVGDNILMENFRKGSTDVLFVNKSTTIKKTPKLSWPVPANLVEIADQLVDPAPPQVQAIASITDENKAVSVQGIITNDEVPKNVGTSGSQKVRNLVLEDSSGSIHVALWNKASTSPVKAGNKVTISHLASKHSTFYQEMALTSSRNTTIAVVEDKPQEMDVVVLAVHAVKEDSIVLWCDFDDKVGTLSMPKEIADTLWDSTTAQDILQALKNRQLYKMILKDKSVISVSPDQE